MSRIWFYKWGTWMTWKPIYVGGDEWNRHTLVFSLPFPGSPAMVVAMGKWWPCHCMDDLPLDYEAIAALDPQETE